MGARVELYSVQARFGVELNGANLDGVEAWFLGTKTQARGRDVP